MRKVVSNLKKMVSRPALSIQDENGRDASELLQAIEISHASALHHVYKTRKAVKVLYDGRIYELRAEE